MLVASNQITPSQQQDLDKLCARCYEKDGGLPALYPHILKQKRETDNNLFYYQEKELVGFLSVYFFYEDACEISLMVAPEHRGQGLAARLVKAIMPLLDLRRMKTIIFSTPDPMENSWFAKAGFQYRQTEYYMERASFAPILIHRPQLSLRLATLADVELLCAIDCAAFTGQVSVPERFYTMMSDQNYSIFLAYKQHIPVGKAHIRWQTETALFSDIAILPPFQKKGLGSELIAHCINQSLGLGKIKMALDVETTNSHALNLYKRYGFNTTKTHHFWEMPLTQLKQKLT